MTRFSQTKWLIPTMKQELPDPKKVAEKLKVMNKALDDIEVRSQASTSNE